MIYLAKKIIDVQNAIDVLVHFLHETSYDIDEIDFAQREHLGKLVYTIINSNNYVWLAEVDSKTVGILIAVIEPNMWMPKLKQMRELVWFVLPEYRNTTIGAKLFLEYCNTAEELINNKKINGYFTTIMPTTKSIDLEKRGFELKEYIYLKRGEI